jgi:nitrous oxidase accessory protein
MARALAAIVAICAAALLMAGSAFAQEQGLGAAATLQSRIDNAEAGELVIVDGGVFHERIMIEKSITLVARNSPVIDGDALGDVVTITADDVTFTGFVVRGSSRKISLEPAAIKVNRADRVTLRGNLIEDSYFGIHLRATADSTIENNVLDLSEGVDIGRRGYGIYMWRVTNSVIHGNVIRNASDGIHLEFSEGNGIGQNDVRASRYGLHFMYSDGNKVLENTFLDNLAGGVFMFSHDMLVKDNEFSSNRKGAAGTGMLFKDCDNVYVEGNRLIKNKIGVSVEGTPQEVGATAIFRENLFALNDSGIALMSNAPIVFVENAMIDNTVQVKALGSRLASRLLSSHSGDGEAPLPDVDQAGTPLSLPEGVAWTSNGRGNYWSDYGGYDADGDGVGDRPYLSRAPLGGRLEQNDNLRLFQFTLAQEAIDVAAKMFPIYRYDPVMEDPAPLMRPPDGVVLLGGEGMNAQLLLVSLGLVGMAVWWLSMVRGGTIASLRKRVRLFMGHRRKAHAS